MKLTGELKKKVEEAKTREAARETIANAGMLLNDDELDQVSGGLGDFGTRRCYCDDCQKEFNMYGGLKTGQMLMPACPDCHGRITRYL